MLDSQWFLVSQVSDRGGLTVRMTRYWLGALLVLLAVASTSAQQFRTITVDEMKREKRIALVIGNGAYASGKLNNPVNDARAMTQALKRMGFEVMAFENVNSAQFRRAVAAFGEKLGSGGPGPRAGPLFYSRPRHPAPRQQLPTPPPPRAPPPRP